MNRVANYLNVGVKEAKYYLEVDLTGSCRPSSLSRAFQEQAMKILNDLGYDISGGKVFPIGEVP